MADPISILAIAGLVYAGRTLSKPHKETYEPEMEEQPLQETPDFVIPDSDDTVVIPSKKVEMPQFGDIAPQQKSSGQEILEMRDRMFDTGRMNNLAPIEKQQVGPGLGVGSEIPSFGGYQQLFRVNPVNVGEYKLTTLPGRTGPGGDITGGRRGLVGQLGNNRPEKTAFLPERLPTVPGRAQGMSGVTPRQEHERTKRTTNRSETGLRTDGLSNAPAKRFIPMSTRAQDPTRNKKDGNIEQYKYANQPAPGIHSFHHGYINAPGSKIGEKRIYGTPHTVEELQNYGFRPDDRRGKPNRAGGAGRMNVRAGPLNQGGLVTSMRADSSRIDGRVNAANGAWTQQYENSKFHQFNAYKGMYNPHATNMNLDLAKHQLQKNPLAHSLS